ncbi:hypothetical protein [Oceanobacillus neutriphilus]|uniref:Nucleotidyl transferase AbiEii toxin, Type IV TA system n=1 Tax=Oceanobacillus neutriphilus TaxID=531815 RepID=A0ABQ2NWD5_9BACI|nr:hypothetical protein [Oceanobacillus neutriphilus]GGP12217.1 hypothetical protein GCM10011346_27330 [Oceanobacillus neutriphilus]
MLHALAKTADILNEKNIVWGLGGSLMLHMHGMIDSPNDIDLLVSEIHAPLAEKVLDNLGERKEAVHSPPFKTAFFAKYRVKNTPVDLMGGYSIIHEEGTYKLAFEKNNIVDSTSFNGKTIYLSSLEDWYVLYSLMPNRKEKVELIEQHFKENGIAHPDLLLKALKQPLPGEVKNKIHYFLP